MLTDIVYRASTATDICQETDWSVVISCGAGLVNSGSQVDAMRLVNDFACTFSELKSNQAPNTRHLTNQRLILCGIIIIILFFCIISIIYTDLEFAGVEL